jgi:hypothetical protein
VWCGSVSLWVAFSCSFLCRVNLKRQLETWEVGRMEFGFGSLNGGDLVLFGRKIFILIFWLCWLTRQKFRLKKILRGTVLIAEVYSRFRRTKLNCLKLFYSRQFFLRIKLCE